MKFLKWLWGLVGGPAAPAPALVDKAIAETVKACGFVPAVSTVVSIIGAMTGQGAAAATAVGVANTICKAVKSVPVSLFGADVQPLAEVGDELIPIEGEFVGSDRLR